MSDIDAQPNEGTQPHSGQSGMAQILSQQLPYIGALVLAIAGVAYTNISHQCRGSEIRSILAASPSSEFLNHKRHWNHKLASVLIESEVRTEGAAK